MKINYGMIYWGLLIALLALSIALIVWINIRYLFDDGYVVIPLIVVPLFVVVMMTNSRFFALRIFPNRLMMIVIISLIWSSAAVLIAYYYIFNRFGV